MPSPLISLTVFGLMTSSNDKLMILPSKVVCDNRFEYDIERLGVERIQEANLCGVYEVISLPLEPPLPMFSNLEYEIGGGYARPLMPQILVDNLILLRHARPNLDLLRLGHFTRRSLILIQGRLRVLDLLPAAIVQFGEGAVDFDDEIFQRLHVGVGVEGAEHALGLFV